MRLLPASKQGDSVLLSRMVGSTLFEANPQEYSQLLFELDILAAANEPHIPYNALSSLRSVSYRRRPCKDVQWIPISYPEKHNLTVCNTTNRLARLDSKIDSKIECAPRIGWVIPHLAAKDPVVIAAQKHGGNVLWRRIRTVWKLPHGAQAGTVRRFVFP